MRETSTNSNLNEIIRDMITEGQVVQTDQLLCDGKVKASLLLKTSNEKQHIVEIVEDELAHFIDLEGKMKLR